MTPRPPEEIFRRLYHGFPPTVDECRWLWEQAFGPAQWKPPRCKRCGGDGKAYGLPKHAPFGFRPFKITCDQCQGAGYADAQKTG